MGSRRHVRAVAIAAYMNARLKAAYTALHHWRTIPWIGSRTGLSAGTRSLAQEDDTALSALWKWRISNTEIMLIIS
ncbi:hypothetical protein ALC57_17548 [Trachymyrmex cornetzi]|uniref:Uncharacterized protein n=1 Tax=Trachymyrmex cornetzi TaxID=471704 RepID=A0A195DBW1_9HYME|nr:hypothetical protein ALC57_17548 [Trachymyrmex cornetzi]